MSGVWNVDASGTFAVAANWAGNAVPAGGGTATFPAIISADRTVTLAATTSLGGLTFADPDQAYTLAVSGTATLTLLPGITGEAAPINVSAGTHTITAPIAGTTSVTKVGNGTLVLAGNSTFIGDTAVNAGVLRVTSVKALGPAAATNAVGVAFGGQLELAGVDLGARDVLLASNLSSTPTGSVRAIGTGASAIGGTVFIVQPTAIGVSDPAGSLTLSGELIDNGIGGLGTLAKVGPGTLNVRRFGGAMSGPAGAPVPIATLQIDAGLARVMPSGGATASTGRVNVLSIASSGATLDLTDNALVIDYSGASPIQTLRGDLLAGRLTASGLASGVTVGYADASTLNLATFAGQPVDATALVMRPTIGGDADLNGAVDFADLLAMARTYGQPGVWTSGDFDYSGQVDFADLLILARQYGQGGTSATGSAAALQAAGISGDTVDKWLSAVQIVPEPSFGACFAVIISARGLLGRKSCGAQ